MGRFEALSRVSKIMRTLDELESFIGHEIKSSTHCLAKRPSIMVHEIGLHNLILMTLRSLIY